MRQRTRIVLYYIILYYTGNTSYEGQLLIAVVGDLEWMLARIRSPEAHHLRGPVALQLIEHSLRQASNP